MAYTIIWIEDDIDIIFPVIQQIVNDGHKIIAYSSIDEARQNLSIIKTADLILLDAIMLPPDDYNEYAKYPGVDFLKEIRQDHNLDIPVVLFTVVSTKLEERLIGLNVDDIVYKPAEPMKLKQTVINSIEKRGKMKRGEAT